MYQNGYPNNYQPLTNTPHSVHQQILVNQTQMPHPQMYQQPMRPMQSMPTYRTQQSMQVIPMGRGQYQGQHSSPHGFQPIVNNRRMQQQRMVNHQSNEPKGLKKLLKKKEQPPKQPTSPTSHQNPTLKSPSLLKQAFVGPDGKFDLTQTIQTVEQVTKAMNEVSPIVAQVRSMFQKT